MHKLESFNDAFIKIDNYDTRLEKLQELLNQRNQIDGLELLSKLNNEIVKACFFDPQYRSILDKMQYGNEGKSKEKRRFVLPSMTNDIIKKFIKEIDRVLMPSGHLFLWIDKFQLCEGFKHWIDDTKLSVVDLMIWEKSKIGMGYRTRNKCEFLVILQKRPTKAKGVWVKHDIPNVLKEDVDTSEHPHAKPIELQRRLIESVSNEYDLILDPAMGSGSVFTACQQLKRNFIGGDING